MSLLQHRPPEWGKVRGELIRWIRQQLHLSLREVQQKGGPSPAYQCEVENGKKNDNVTSDILDPWLAIFGVVQEFVRGPYQPISINPVVTQWLCWAVTKRVTAKMASPAWKDLPTNERVRFALCEIIADLGMEASAFSLELDVDELSGLKTGDTAIPLAVIERIAQALGLEKDAFFEDVYTPGLVAVYTEGMRLAYRHRLSPDDLVAAVERWIGQAPGQAGPADQPNPGR